MCPGCLHVAKGLITGGHATEMPHGGRRQGGEGELHQVRREVAGEPSSDTYSCSVYSESRSGSCAPRRGGGGHLCQRECEGKVPGSAEVDSDQRFVCVSVCVARGKWLSYLV